MIVNYWKNWWPLLDSNQQPKDYKSRFSCFLTFLYFSQCIISLLFVEFNYRSRFGMFRTISAEISFHQPNVRLKVGLQYGSEYAEVEKWFYTQAGWIDIGARNLS